MFYVRSETAKQLQPVLATKTLTGPFLRMPCSSDVVDMFRVDLEDARQQWVNEVGHNPQEQEHRRQGDFLAYQDSEGRKLDFHSLWYTTGA